jgi:glyoxylase-like metal-dependent hydrolase (beta-lactamase superfamily II)
MSFVLDDRSIVFTGDCLLIRGSGRTDLQDGNASALHRSVHTRLYVLPVDVRARRTLVVLIRWDLKAARCRPSFYRDTITRGGAYLV